MPALGENSGKVVLCASTCDPDRIAALGARVVQRGLCFLETPVSGTSEQVRRGQGVGLIGGDREVAARIAPVLRALFASYFSMSAGSRRRTREARNQPDTRPQPPGACRRPGVRRAPRAGSRGHSCRLRAPLPPIRRLWTQGPEDAGARLHARRPRADGHPQGCDLMLDQAVRCASLTAAPWRSMPTCSKLACVPAKATATTASSSRRSSGGGWGRERARERVSSGAGLSEEGIARALTLRCGLAVCNGPRCL